MGKVYVGDTPLLKYDFGEDITDLDTGPKMHYQDPDGDTGSWTATLATQYASYQTVAGDINKAGRWLFQPILSDGTKEFAGEVFGVTVHSRIT